MSSSDAVPVGMEETLDVSGGFPRLSENQIDILSHHGERRPTEVGQVLFREGETIRALYVILSGKVGVVEGFGAEERVLSVHGPRRFLGELGLLIGQPAFVTAVVCEPGEVLVVDADQLRDLLIRETTLADTILSACLARRSALIELGVGLRIIGSRFSPETADLRDFAARNRLPHRVIDLEGDGSVEALLRQLGVRPDETPVVIWRSKVLRNPRVAELGDLLGLRTRSSAGDVFDLVIVGAGPAGLAAAVYGASEGLTTIVLDRTAAGGQAGLSPRIENYLGFPSGIPGAELAERAVVQARKFGATLSVPADVTGLDVDTDHHCIRLADGTSIAGRATVIASGVSYRRLAAPGVERFERTSVFYAATPAEGRLCGKDAVAVIGGGNSAGQAVLFLTRYASQVHLLIRGEDLTAMSRYLADRIERHEQVKVWFNTEVRELVGDGTLEALVVEDTRSRERRRLRASAVFVFIGVEPRVRWLEGKVALDERGFVRTGAGAADSATTASPGRLESSCPGVYAVGDVRSGSIKRVAAAVGEGAMVVSFVHDRLGGVAGHVVR